MIKPNKLIHEALQLDPAQRFLLIEALVHSLDTPDPRIEEAWIKEAENRLQAYKDGKLKTVSLEDMFGKEV